MGETCEVCGRPQKQLWTGPHDGATCARGLIVDHPAGAAAACYRIGYEREKARADAAEAILAEYRGWSPSRTDLIEALAAARRECEVMRAALTTIRDGLNKPWLMGSEVHRVAVDCANAVLEADAALAAPAAGEELDLDAIEADAYGRDMGDR